MSIDDFAPNLSFFFSNGMDAEYTVIGRAARRIWAVAMRDRYGANARSQQLKYHVQTSGRSLHADRKSTRLNSSHANISYAVFCLKTTYPPEPAETLHEGQPDTPSHVRPDAPEPWEINEGAAKHTHLNSSHATTSEADFSLTKPAT